MYRRHIKVVLLLDPVPEEPITFPAIMVGILFMADGLGFGLELFVTVFAVRWRAQYQYRAGKAEKIAHRNDRCLVVHVALLDFEE